MGTASPDEGAVPNASAGEMRSSQGKNMFKFFRFFVKDTAPVNIEKQLASFYADAVRQMKKRIDVSDEKIAIAMQDAENGRAKTAAAQILVEKRLKAIDILNGKIAEGKAEQVHLDWLLDTLSTLAIDLERQKREDDENEKWIALLRNLRESMIEKLEDANDKLNEITGEIKRAA
jgi:hypothetical protein